MSTVCRHYASDNAGAVWDEEVELPREHDDGVSADVCYAGHLVLRCLLKQAGVAGLAARKAGVLQRRIITDSPA